jgi:hypothetical protein
LVVFGLPPPCRYSMCVFKCVVLHGGHKALRLRRSLL